MPYPSLAEITDAVQYPAFINDAILKNSIIETNFLGPVSFAGGFCIVFPLVNGKDKWALRVWNARPQEGKERYIKISNYLKFLNSKYFVDFSYVENGLIVNGTNLDIIRMEWVDGLTLKDYIYENLNNKDLILDLAENFKNMVQYLHKYSISHGDLQHENILISQNRIQLIDYDSICIPELLSERQYVFGLPGFQHPSRLKKSFTSLKADYFSELIIYISLKVFAYNNSFWGKYKVQTTQDLLFSSNDFKNFDNSEIKKDLLALNNNEITKLLKTLEWYLSKADIDELVPFYEWNGTLTLPQPPTPDPPTPDPTTSKIPWRTIAISLFLLIICSTVITSIVIYKNNHKFEDTKTTGGKTTGGETTGGETTSGETTDGETTGGGENVTNVNLGIHVHIPNQDLMSKNSLQDHLNKIGKQIYTYEQAGSIGNQIQPLCSDNFTLLENGVPFQGSILEFLHSVHMQKYNISVSNMKLNNGKIELIEIETKH